MKTFKRLALIAFFSIYLFSCQKEKALQLPIENRMLDKDYFQAFNDFNSHFVQLTMVAEDFEKCKVLANKISKDLPLESDRQAFAKLLKFNSYSEFEGEAKKLISFSQSFYNQFSYIKNENLKRFEMQDRINKLILKFPEGIKDLSEDVSMEFNYTENPLDYVDPYDNDGNEEEGGGADRCKNEYTACVALAWSVATYSAWSCVGPQAPICLTAVSIGYAAALTLCYYRLEDCRKSTSIIE